MNIKRLMDLGCYRGLRPRKGLPVDLLGRADCRIEVGFGVAVLKSVAICVLTGRKSFAVGVSLAGFAGGRGAPGNVALPVLAPTGRQ